MALTIPFQTAKAKGLLPEHRKLFEQLMENWQAHTGRNLVRHDYYLMHNLPKALGIAVPEEMMSNLNCACGWAKKTVDVMVEHSRFDSYNSSDDNIDALLNQVAKRNNLENKYRKATTSALTYGFNAYFVTRDADGHAQITPRTAATCTGLWDDAECRCYAGAFVVSMQKDPMGRPTNQPNWVDVVTDDVVIKLTCDERFNWTAEYTEHGMGQCPMFIAAYESTLDRPFGSSRITREVMGYIDEAVRLNVDEAVAAAFAASPQRYLLGTDGNPFENVSRYQAYIGSIFNIDMTADGTIPQYGSLPQPSLQPLTDHFRNLCGRMSAATGVHVSQFGQVHDQPASSDAIYMENEPLILKCKDWHNEVGHTLEEVAYACLAVELNRPVSDIKSLDIVIDAGFENPAMPTLAQMTDSAIKLASQIEGFAETDTFRAMIGLTKPERRRLQKELENVRLRMQGNNLLAELENISDEAEVEEEHAHGESEQELPEPVQ